MIAAFAGAHASLLDALGRAEVARRVDEVRAEFVRRAGAWSPEDAWFEEHAAAFADRALCDREIRRTLAQRAETERTSDLAASLGRSARGLFAIDRHGAKIDLRCFLCGGAFRLADGDDLGGVRFADAKSDHVEALIDARLVATSLGVITLPGVLAHPADARAAIATLLADETCRAIDHDRLLDALLFLRHELASRSRMRAPQVYRVDALKAAIAR